MLFSIIVPIYKVEKYLHECIESILEQTFPDFELILVDDGSPDNCPEICDEYESKDSRIKVIHKINGGLVSARKAGSEIAQGDYIIAVDGDDFISPNMLFELKKIIDETDYDIICFGHYNYFDSNNLKEIKYVEFKNQYHRQQLEQEIFPMVITGEDGRRFPPSIWGKVFKRELYVPIQLQVPDKISIGEDSCVTYPCVYKSKNIFISDQCFYYYRQNLSSMTKQKNRAFDWEEVLDRANHYKYYFQDKIYEEQIARITVHSFFNVAVTEFYVNNYKKAKKKIKEKLEDSRFKYYLERAYFRKNFFENLSLFALRHKLYFLICIYSKFF